MGVSLVVKKWESFIAEVIATSINNDSSTDPRMRNRQNEDKCDQLPYTSYGASTSYSNKTEKTG